MTVIHVPRSCLPAIFRCSICFASQMERWHWQHMVWIITGYLNSGKKKRNGQFWIPFKFCWPIDIFGDICMVDWWNENHLPGAVRNLASLESLSQISTSSSSLNSKGVGLCLCPLVSADAGAALVEHSCLRKEHDHPMNRECKLRFVCIWVTGQKIVLRKPVSVQQFYLPLCMCFPWDVSVLLIKHFSSCANHCPIPKSQSDR